MLSNLHVYLVWWLVGNFFELSFEYLLIKLTSIEMWYWIQSEQCLSIIHTISNPIICFIYFFFVIFKFIQLTVIIFNFNFFIDKYNNSKHCFVVFQYIQLNILMKNEQNEFQFLEVANNDT